MQQDIFQTWFFQQSPGEVWEYLTNPELMAQWLMKSDFKPVVGHRFHFQAEPNDDCKGYGAPYCEVLEVVPTTRLSYTWVADNHNRGTVVDSKVTWTLTEKDGGTELQLHHNGFTLLEDMETHQRGWSALVTQLGELLNAVVK